jgi:hypothetical protein
VTAPLPEADALAVRGVESMVYLCPVGDDGPEGPPPAWARLGATRDTVAWRGWRWLAYAEDLSADAGWRVRVYDAAGRCVWDTVDNPPPVARIEPPARPRTELPPKLLAALLAAPEHWDEVRALLAGDVP